MIKVTLAELRRSTEWSESGEVIAIEDARRKKAVGFFIPIALKDEFESFLDTLERRRREEKLRRVAKAQRRDPIEEGGLDEGLA
jgi:hypothetical protein